jgi:hypothetical protein
MIFIYKPPVADTKSTDAADRLAGGLRIAVGPGLLQPIFGNCYAGVVVKVENHIHAV